MDTTDRTDRAARALVALAGIIFVLVGAIFFLAPAQSAEQFPWNVSPFVAMTIGAWAIGTGLVGLDSARTWDLPHDYPGLTFLWTFSLLELMVVVAFLGALRTDHWLTVPYLAALIVGSASAVPGVAALVRRRSQIRSGHGVPAWIRVLTVIFLLVVGFLAISLLLRGSNVPGGSVFPEQLTLFTVRAFSAFFFALIAAAASLLLSRDTATSVGLARAGLFLIVPITVATLLNLDKFDFAGRPGGLIYIGLYLLTAGLALFSVVWWSRRNDEAAAIDGLPASADRRR